MDAPTKPLPPTPEFSSDSDEGQASAGRNYLRPRCQSEKLFLKSIYREQLKDVNVRWKPKKDWNRFGEEWKLYQNMDTSTNAPDKALPSLPPSPPARVLARAKYPKRDFRVHYYFL